jgi:hypothetical protein
MASLPADEDYARSLLAIFGSRNIRARESLVLREVEARIPSREHGKARRFRGRDSPCDEPRVARVRARQAPIDRARRRGNADGFMACPRRPRTLPEGAALTAKIAAYAAQLGPSA